MSADDSARDHLILSPPEWRQALREELVANGLGQDAAGVVARRVVERLVGKYLTGKLESRSLDDAA